MQHIREQGAGKEKAANRWGILAVLVMCPFMATIDSSIVNVALPVLTSSLGVSAADIAWVVSSYLIAISASILFLGRLGDIIGHIRVLQYGMVVFGIGSLLCGLSHSFILLVLSRIVQAIGAAGMMANNQGIITRVFPGTQRGRALGINAAFVALGTLVGPAVGGLILTFATWEYLFWINVPICIAVVIVGHILYPKEEETVREKVDIPGTALFALAITALFIGLGQAQTLGLTHPLVFISLPLAVILFAWFLRVQTTSASPLLRLDIFRSKWFSVSIFCAFCSYVAISCSNLVLPFYLQDLLRFTPGTAGLYLTVYPLVVALIAPLSGYLSDKVGSEALTLMGLILTSVGLFLLSTLGAQPAHMNLILYIAIMAAGNGMFQSPNNSIVMAAVPKGQVGVGGSVNALVRNLGFTFGIALSTSLLYGGMSARLGTRVTGYVPGQDGAFIYGMRLAYLGAAGVCLLGAIITLFRLYGKRERGSRSTAR